MVASVDELSSISFFQDIAKQNQHGYWVSQHGHQRLGSRFQPIYSLSHRKPVGYEGLLTASDLSGRTSDPETVLQAETSEYGRVILDRLARYLHIKNFVELSVKDGLLFLNVHPDVVLHGARYGSFFEEVLLETGVPTNRIVIEILENSINNNKQLARFIDFYRDLGCLIAIDDFGAGSSNFDRVWRIQPDIVKLDQSIALEMEKNTTIQRMLPNFVSLIHECGSLALLEGIESSEQALIAIDSGIDFVQGYYFASPQKEIDQVEERECIGEGCMDLATLCRKYSAYTKNKINKVQKQISIYSDTFERAVSDFMFPGCMNAFSKVLALSGVERCYLLDENGKQIGINYFPDEHEQLYPQRFNYYGDPESASWFRRPYFRRAMQNPGVMQVSRPYLSGTAGIICITLSICIEMEHGEKIVFCCDIDWSDR